MSNNYEIVEHDGRPALLIATEDDGAKRMRLFATGPHEVDEYVYVPAEQNDAQPPAVNAEPPSATPQPADPAAAPVEPAQPVIAPPAQ